MINNRDMSYQQKVINKVVKELIREGKTVPPEFLKNKKHSFFDFFRKSKSDAFGYDKFNKYDKSPVSLEDVSLKKKKQSFFDFFKKSKTGAFGYGKFNKYDISPVSLEDDDAVYDDILSQRSVQKIIERFIYYSRLNHRNYLYEPKEHINYSYIPKEEPYVVRESGFERSYEPDLGEETKDVHVVVYQEERKNETYKTEEDIFRQGLKDYLRNPENTVCEFVMKKANAKHLNNNSIYKKVNMTKQTFSKIISNQTKSPKFESCIQLALGLKLNLEETNELLRLAGKAFSDTHQHKVIEQYIKYNYHDYYKLNALLYEYGLPTLDSEK